MKVAFKNQQYKELRWVHPFDIATLIGNVGIYVGLFFGFLLQWQGPETFIAVFGTLKGLFSMKSKVLVAEKFEKDGSENTKEKAQETFSDTEVDKEYNVKKIHFLKLDGDGLEEIDEDLSDWEHEKAE